MLLPQFSKAVGAAAAFAAIVLAGMLISSPRGQAQGDGNDDESKIQQGFAIAPVPLNLGGRNRALVGLGSYIVNAQADCNGCHTMDPSTEFTATGNPYLLRPPNGPFRGKTAVNPKTYLGGGSDFGAFPGPGPFPHIFTRNLTPDKTGRPEGGHTFQEFLTIFRTGKDYDHLHPTCTGAPNGTCLPAPFNGELLQIMPWPTFQNMSDDDIRAIYEYLSAIPCIDTIVAGQPQLRNVCH
jgi:hypothetical protein